MANKVKCPSGYILNGKGECVPISLSRPPTPLPLSTVKNNKSDTIVKKTTKKAVMSKDEFRDKKTAINQAKKLEDLQNGVPSRAGRVTKEIISGIGAAAAAGVGIKSLFSKNPSNSFNNPDFKNGGKATNKKVNIMAVVKKKVVAPKKKVAPVKGAWVPPWAKKAVTEKKTGEKYPSKAAMAKHEKGESKKVRKAEGEIPKARNGGKTCSCGKASCTMCGGKHKKYDNGGKTTTKGLYKGVEYNSKGDVISKYDVSSKTGDRNQYAVYADGKPVKHTYNPTTKVYRRAELDTLGYSKGKQSFIKTVELKKGNGKTSTTKTNVPRKEVKTQIKSMQTMKRKGGKMC